VWVTHPPGTAICHARRHRTTKTLDRKKGGIVQERFFEVMRRKQGGGKEEGGNIRSLLAQRKERGLKKPIMQRHWKRGHAAKEVTEPDGTSLRD